MYGTEKLIDVRIQRRRDEADGIISFELVSCDGELLPAFEAGAHVHVHLGPGLVRQYSLCNDPAEQHRYRLAVLLEKNGRGGSVELHHNFVDGRIAQISLPQNNFRLVEDAEHSVLLAGGIGITPLLSMAFRLHGLGRSFELHYLSRNLSRTAFLAEFADFGFAQHLRIYHDENPTAQRFDLTTALPSPRSGTHVYLCGPQGFMDAIIRDLKANDWTDHHIHQEHFAANVDKTGDRFLVEAKRSGKTVSVESGQTIARALSDVGIEVPLSCEEGICGICLLDVIEGVPDHRDIYQTEVQKVTNRKIAPCCSRALSPVLVLDI
jgi:vanillate monooxygenase ferredoxin subunit